MSAEEFMKQQYLTLRDEIRASKSRVFFILVIGTLFVPFVAFAAKAYGSTFASASLPFIMLVLMLAFVMEQNSIVRAGKYLKDHVEPNLPGHPTWEAWLEANSKLRDVDKYFFASFLIVFLVFYAASAGLAYEALLEVRQGVDNQHWFALGGYAVGGLWFVIVWLSHWRMCTTTK
jgi:hypothetical protein